MLNKFIINIKLIKLLKNHKNNKQIFNKILQEK